MLNYPTYIRHKQWAKLLHLLEVKAVITLRRTQWLQEMGKIENEKSKSQVSRVLVMFRLLKSRCYLLSCVQFNQTMY